MKIIVKVKTDYMTWADLKEEAENGIISDIIESGDIICLTLKNGEEIAVKVAYDENNKLFFVLEDCLKEEYAMNKHNTAYGGWKASKMRRYLNKTLFVLLPDDLQAAIVPTHIVQNANGEHFETDDNLFLLSRTQVYGKGPWSTNEPEDTQLDCFLREKDRVKEDDEGTSWWWLRSSDYCDKFDAVSCNGKHCTYNPNLGLGIVFGFCIT